MDAPEKEDFDLQGRIGNFTLSDILQSLSFTQKTGTLTLIQGWNTRTICYEHGRITYIAAATRLPSVVDLLIQAGRLSIDRLEHGLGSAWKEVLGVRDPEHLAPDRVATSVTLASVNGHSNGNGSTATRTRLHSRSLSPSDLRNTGVIETDYEDFDAIEAFAPDDYGLSPASVNDVEIDTARILLKYKLVSQEEVAWCEEQMLEATIYTLFLWRNCRFTFQGDLLVKSDGMPISVSAEKLIIEGTRRVDEWIKISPVVPSVLMAFRRLPKPVTGPLSDEAREVLALVDGVSDVATIARKRQRTQFDTAKLLHGLTQLRMVQPVPPEKKRVMELFRYTAEAIYIKLVMYGYSRKAMEFEYELNRFARENRLKVRMHIGKIRLTDVDLPIDTIALLDLYKLFIAIENNKFAKLFPPEIHNGLTEALYQHMDTPSRALMRMYEFHAMEGLLQMPPVEVE